MDMQMAAFNNQNYPAGVQPSSYLGNMDSLAAALASSNNHNMLPFLPPNQIDAETLMNLNRRAYSLDESFLATFGPNVPSHLFPF
jgi:hypothetical protein